MADFTTVRLECNRGNTASPNFVAIGAANTEVRFSDVGTGLLATASAAWPAMVRPAATANIAYTYLFDADATGTGFYSASTGTGGTGVNPPVFANGNYLWARWSWDALGTFASAPIFTAYYTTGHITPASRNPAAGTANLLDGNATDTGATARSYLKANAYGTIVTGATATTAGTGAPAAAPTNAPVVTDGATGALIPTAGANWLTNFQGLMADLDYIQFPSTPAAVTAGWWNVIFALFTGPNMTPGNPYTWQHSFKYTFA